MSIHAQLRAGSRLWLVLPLVLCVLIMLGIRLTGKRPGKATAERVDPETRPAAVSNHKGAPQSSPVPVAPPKDPSKARQEPLPHETSILMVNVRDAAGHPLPGLQVGRVLSGGPTDNEGPPLRDRRVMSGGGSFIIMSGVFEKVQPVTDAEGRATIVINHKRLRGKQFIITVDVSGERVVKDAFAEFKLNLPPPGTVREITLTPRLGRVLRGRLLNMAPEDAEDMTVRFEEVSDSRSGWSDWPDIGPDGSFRTETVPMVPLVLEVDHDRGKYLPVRQEIDPSRTDEIVIALQPNPEYRRGQFLEVQFLAPGPVEGSVNAKVTVFRQPGWVVEMESAYSLDFVRPSRHSLRPGNYRFLAVSLGGMGLYGEATGVLSPESDLRITVPLRKSAQVFVAPRDQRTGKPFPHSRAAISVEWSPDGNSFVWVTAAFASRETYERTGEMVADAPPGHLRIVVWDRDGKYEPVTLRADLAGGEVGRFTAALVPR